MPLFRHLICGNTFVEMIIMDALGRQLVDCRPSVLSLGGTIGEELYHEVCTACSRWSNVDWNSKQHGRIIGLAKRIRTRMIARGSRRSQRRVVFFSDLSSLPDPAEGDRSSAAVSEQWLAVVGALRVLSRRRRRALLLHFHGFPDARIAAQLAVTAVRVRQWRHRDLIQLRHVCGIRRQPKT